MASGTLLSAQLGSAQLGAAQLGQYLRIGGSTPPVTTGTKGHGGFVWFGEPSKLAHDLILQGLDVAGPADAG